ncbi:phage holin family protein [Yersinia ruckeri]|nr:phage holin family protein [Yersinia ruckeri]MCK8543813.1 phage holin family protein [Yersinia ruckeri]MCK8553392.1 phage holin family protein [Yersinia ruckeri]MCK8573058.1 phage holin family protein [Yersinia ruckeri]MCK8577663.1 phage holin family protein [Yersinia ruckeri]
MPWKSDASIWSAILAVLMTSLGMLASYAYKVLSGEKFSWRTLALQAFVSAFAGALMYLASTHYQWPPEIIGVVCGLAGWSGSSLIKTLEAKFLNRVGVDNANQ